MRLSRSSRAVRLVAALAVACLSLLVIAAAHGGITNGAASAASSAPCPPEASACAQATFPSNGTCPGCTAEAGPVTNVGLNQAVYVDVSGVPIGDDLEIAYCSIAGTGTAPQAEPNCASESYAPAQQTYTTEPEQYQYGTVTSTDTVLSMETQFDPDIAGASPIVSETGSQLDAGTHQFGQFFCDNGSNGCAIEVMDIPQVDIVQDVSQNGFPPNDSFDAIAPTNTVIFPLTFNEGGSGCGSAPVLSVDASYSATQFLPAAGEATCTGPDGVAAVPTELPSVDDPGCTSGGGASCPIEQLINGTVPATFTDDPEDPATLAELKAAGGNFAYIPIALSATEIAFSGVANENGTNFPLDSYQLTPAQAAGIMTQLWTAPVASGGNPNDDLCAELTELPKSEQCTETMQSNPQNLLVYTADGKTDNLDVSQSSSQIPKTESFDLYEYGGNFANNRFSGRPIGSNPKVTDGDTGYVLLNPWPFTFDSTGVSEDALAAMWPSTASGATFQTTGWMCNTPNLAYSAPLPFGGQATVQDIMSGQQILADAEMGPIAAQGNTNGLPPGIVDQHIVYPANECQTLSSLPIDFGQLSPVSYQPSSQPPIAAHAVTGAVLKLNGTGGGFAFTAMDSSEADFFGLLPASLQNAAGAFVGPSAQSITDAVNDASTNPDGTLSPNYNDTSDPGAYPLPMVTYALVSTSAQPSVAQATQLKDLLTNLVTYSHNGGSASEPLPAGYVPLPSTLYSQAVADIAKDIVTPPASPGGSGGSGGSGGTTNTAAATSGAPGGAGGVTGGAGFVSHPGSAAHGAGGRGTAPATGLLQSASANGPSSSGNFAGHFITVTVGDSRFFVPGLLILALLCLLAGPLLYLSPTLRKTAGANGEGVDEGGAEPSGGPEPPEGG